MKVRTDFEFTKIDDGEYDFITENPQYNQETNTISIMARVSGGDSDGSGIPDYYNLTPKEDGKTAFGIIKLAAYLMVTGVEPETDFQNKDELNGYYAQLSRRLGDVSKMNALTKKIDGLMFTGVVKSDKTGKYQNIVNYKKKQAKQPPLQPQPGSQSSEEESW